VEKIRILITGKVHEVGYRAFLLGLAELFGIDRFFAENKYLNGKQAVEVLVEAEKDKIDAFVKEIKAKKPENAEVEEIKVESYDGIVMRTESYYRYFTAMQLTKIATYGGKMLEKQDRMLEMQEEMLKKQDEMLGKQDKMLEKQDKTLKKQDETIKTIREESEKIRTEIGGKIDELRGDLREFIRENLREIREEIAEIKKALRKAGII